MKAAAWCVLARIVTQLQFNYEMWKKNGVEERRGKRLSCGMIRIDGELKCSYDQAK